VGTTNTIYEILNLQLKLTIRKVLGKDIRDNKLLIVSPIILLVASVTMQKLGYKFVMEGTTILISDLQSMMFKSLTRIGVPIAIFILTWNAPVKLFSQLLFGFLCLSKNLIAQSDYNYNKIPCIEQVKILREVNSY
jgi:hypothetical protein